MKSLIIGAMVCLSGFCYGQSNMDRLRNLGEPGEKEITLSKIPVENGEYIYTGVVKVDSALKKNTLYQNSKIFFVDNFKDANDVIQYDDKESATVIGKGHFRVTEANSSIISPMGLEWDVWFTTKIESKDGRYRYSISDIYIKQRPLGQYSYQTITINDAIKQSKKGVYKKTTATIFNRMVDNLASTEMSIRQAMNSKIVSARSSEW